MQHKFQLTNEIVLFEEIRPREVIHIVDLDHKLLSLLESILYLKVLDEFGVQGILDYLGLSHFLPLVTNQVKKNKFPYFFC